MSTQSIRVKFKKKKFKLIFFFFFCHSFVNDGCLSNCKTVKAEAECATHNQIYNTHLDTVKGGSVMSHSDIALNTRNRNGAAQTLVRSCCGKQKAHLDRLP